NRLVFAVITDAAPYFVFRLEVEPILHRKDTAIRTMKRLGQKPRRIMCYTHPLAPLFLVTNAIQPRRTRRVHGIDPRPGSRARLIPAPSGLSAGPAGRFRRSLHPRPSTTPADPPGIP